MCPAGSGLLSPVKHFSVICHQNGKHSSRDLEGGAAREIKEPHQNRGKERQTGWCYLNTMPMFFNVILLSLSCALILFRWPMTCKRSKKSGFPPSMTKTTRLEPVSGDRNCTLGGQKSGETFQSVSYHVLQYLERGGWCKSAKSFQSKREGFQLDEEKKSSRSFAVKMGSGISRRKDLRRPATQ